MKSTELQIIDMEAVELFLTALFETMDRVTLRPIEIWTEGEEKRSKVIREACRNVFPSVLLDVLRGKAEQIEHARANLFFGVCPRQDKTGYDEAWQIPTVRTLWADIDHCTVGEVEKRIKAAGLPEPSIVVSSGNGAHVYWLLANAVKTDAPHVPIQDHWDEVTEDGTKKPPRRFIEIDGERTWLADEKRRSIPGARPELTEKAQHVQDVIQGVSSLIGGDATQDLSRLLRLPGTLNRKNQRNGVEPKPCVLVKCDGHIRYDFAEFEVHAARSPGKVEREKIAKMPLPAPRKISQGRQDKLDQRLAACAAAEVGQRSEVDYALCCLAVEEGIARGEVWELCQALSKFAEAGSGYFEATWVKAEKNTQRKIYERKVAELQKASPVPVKNAEAVEPKGDSKYEPKGVLLKNYSVEEFTDENGKTKTQKVPLNLSSIADKLHSATDEWPKVLDGQILFHHRGNEDVRYIRKTPQLFAWIGHQLGQPPDFIGANGFHPREDFNEHLIAESENFASIELAPHVPPLDDVYYAHRALPESDGSAFEKLLSFFNPVTPEDAILIRAMFLSAIWGGQPGKKPLFLITAKGTGTGKSTLADMAGFLFGGTFDIQPGDDFGRIRTSLISQDGMKYRIGRIDNLKGYRLSWAEMESLITSPRIVGHRLFVGPGERPNTVLWICTSNAPGFGRDMSQRTVHLQIGKPRYSSGDFDTAVFDFVTEHKWKILADMAAIMETEPATLATATRWGLWESQVLARATDTAGAAAAMQLIASRRGKLDSDAEHVTEFMQYIEHQLTRYGYANSDSVLIPKSVLAKWSTELTGQKTDSRRVSGDLRTGIENGTITNMVEHDMKRVRAFVWIGSNAPQNRDIQDVDKDLEARMEAEQQRIASERFRRF